MSAGFGMRKSGGWTMALVLVAAMGCAAPMRTQAPPASAPSAQAPVPGPKRRHLRPPPSPAPTQTPATQAPPANDLLNAVLWMQRSVEYRATALAAFALARIRLDQALADPNWTAMVPGEQAGPYQSLPPAVITGRRRDDSRQFRLPGVDDREGDDLRSGRPGTPT